METLKSIAPHDDPDHLELLLRKHHFNVKNAYNELYARKSQRGSDISISSDVKEMIYKARLIDVPQVGHLHAMPNTQTPTFYSVKDGNCAPHAMGLCLCYVLNSIPKLQAEHKVIAQRFRAAILQYQRDHFLEASTLTGMPWHQIIYESHNLGIPPSELAEYGLTDWGMNPSHRKDCWERECNDFYFTVSELMAYCEMLRYLNFNVVFRVFRVSNRKLQKVCQIPEGVEGNYVTFDFKHTGRNDTNQAHWELLKSGSIVDKRKRKRDVCK